MRFNDNSNEPLSNSLDVDIRERFDQAKIAASYRVGKNERQTSKNRRELDCIERAMVGIPEGSTILDLPTGTGRLIPMLSSQNMEVIAADYSEHMLDQAKQFWQTQKNPNKVSASTNVSFQQHDIMHINLADNAVDVTICNRLFHHYPTPKLRRQALTELCRVTSQRIILSYFSNFAFSAARFHLKNKLKNHVATDRVPIWPSAMHADIAACGLTLCQTLPVGFGRSPQTYLTLTVPGSR